jgi:multisubunit Na+/H+ antiporter MnhG subunit
MVGRDRTGFRVEGLGTGFVCLPLQMLAATCVLAATGLCACRYRLVCLLLQTLAMLTSPLPLARIQRAVRPEGRQPPRGHVSERTADQP